MNKIAYYGDVTAREVFEYPFAAAIFEALGITPANLVRVQDHMVLSDVVVAEPAFIENSMVHRAYAIMMDRVADLLVPEPVTPDERPVFFSKGRLGRGISRLADEAAFARVLEQGGVKIVHPEELSFREQVKLWKTHRTFSANAGSALHGAAFVTGRNIVSLCNEAHAESNQALIGLAGRHHSLFVHAEGESHREPGDSRFHQFLNLHRVEGTAEAFLNALRLADSDDEDYAYSVPVQNATVCGRIYPNEPFGQNIARGKPARQSSRGPSWTPGAQQDPEDAGRAVSGELSVTFQFITKNEMSPWWDVDLQGRYIVNEIRVFNRNDFSMDRAWGLILLISADGESWTEIGRHVQEHGSFAGGNLAPLRWLSVSTTVARFVRLQLPGKNFLHLNQVEIFGVPADPVFF